MSKISGKVVRVRMSFNKQFCIVTLEEDRETNIMRLETNDNSIAIKKGDFIHCEGVCAYWSTQDGARSNVKITIANRVLWKRKKTVINCSNR